MLKYILFLINLLAISVECLEGTEESLCYKRIRTTQAVYLDNNKVIQLPRWESHEHCCAGYQEVNSKCLPVCEKQCVIGECVAPNTCACDNGFIGDDCSIPFATCSDGFWGEECKDVCNCNSSPCERTTGICTCLAGFLGKNCNRKCPEGKFGQDCLERCSCLNGKCEHVTGKCICDIGYAGTNCSEQCPQGKYGNNCSRVCDCLNDSDCDHKTGSCSCLPGYIGTYCESKCHFGKWGEGCTTDCRCGDAGDCDHITGDCICKPGYKGKQCAEHCEEGSYGLNCRETCTCVNGKCSHIDGSCTCDDGWTGINCSKIECSSEIFGHQCTEVCKCEKDNTEACDLNTSKCLCKSGWQGDTCTESCPIGYYGVSCSTKCECKENRYESCDKETGRCNCKKEWKGLWCHIPCDCQNDGYCNYLGQCICQPGWTGSNCSKTCEPGHFGKNCTEICLYVGLGNFICDPIKGDICKTNFEGPQCENCICGTNASCNPITGSCDCRPGLYGLKCQFQCKPGQYGQYCSQQCECENCRHTDGYCPCQPEWNGTVCSEYCPSNLYNNITNQCVENSPKVEFTNTGSYVFYRKYIVIAFGVGCVSILIIVLLVYYLICKKRSEKSDIHVYKNSTKFHAPLTTRNIYEREEPVYEEVQEDMQAPYDEMFRPYEVHNRYHDEQYFDQYEMPRQLDRGRRREELPMQILDYVVLDRNSVGPIQPSAQYYQFKRSDRN